MSVMVPDCIDAAGERHRSCGSAPSCGLISWTGRRYDQLVTRGSSGEGFVSGVSGRHIGTPAT